MTYISPSKVFRHLPRLAGWQAGQRPAPVTVEWDLSNRCYLGCQSCHFAHTHTKGPWVTQDRRLPMAWAGTGDLADTSLVLKTLGNLAAFGVQGVVWSGGGEPTVHPSWQAIVAHAASVGLQQGMYTAGGLLTESSAAHLATHAAWVVVSLDACDPDTYAAEKRVDRKHFACACRGIEWLSKPAKAVVGVSFLLHAHNWTAANAMHEFARSLGASYTTFRPTIETSPDQPSLCTADRSWVTRAMPTLEYLATQPDVEVDPVRFAAYRDWNGRSYDTCHGIKLNTTITPDGRVWVCPQHRGIDGSCVGDLRQESFASLWHRHPGQWTDFASCRVMCRLHQDNQALAPLFATYRHEAFV